MSDLSYSVSAAGRFVRNEAGEIESCFGIDIQAARPAPAGECGRVDIRLDGDPALVDQVLFALYGLFQPDIGGGMSGSNNIPGTLPPSYVRARMRGVSPVTIAGDIGIALDLDDSVLRLRMDVEHARKLRDFLSDYLGPTNCHSEISSGMPSLAVSPQEGMKV